MKYIDDHWVADGRKRMLAITFGLSPIVLMLFAYLFGPQMSGPMFQPSVETQILDLRFLVSSFTLVLSIGSAVVIWRARSWWVVIGTMLLTLAALLLAILGPAVVLILSNLDT